MPTVNPEILTWARETAGLSLDDAAKAIQLKDTKKMSGGERLLALEEGEGKPTQAMLRKMANKYRRPLLVFYLRDIPELADRGEDFRRVPGTPPPDFNPRLDALIRNVRSRHDIVKSLLEDEEAELLTFVGSCAKRDGVETVAQRITADIGFQLDEFRHASGYRNAFKYLRGRLEANGLFVLLLGNLGSYHSNISASVFRGYSIADDLAPFIVINDNDADAAWSFTALHEAAHIWLGQTGISGSTAEARIEKFCNEVAGRILLPSQELRWFPNLEPLAFNDVINAVSTFASERNISRQMVIFQLFRTNMIDGTIYKQLSRRFNEDWMRRKEQKNNNDDAKINRYVVLRHRLGPALIGLARRSLDGGGLTPTKASQLLGVKPVSISQFLKPDKVKRGKR